MSEFVIVIEADNKRAHAAYLKGLSDLELIWPQVMEYATLVDERRTAEYERESELYRQSFDKHLEEVTRYCEEVAKREKAFIKGPMPRYPYRSWRLHFAPPMPSSKVAYFESIKAELKSMADLSGVATGPYRMTERQVKGMIGWEDGSQIEAIKSEIGKEFANA